MSPIILGQTLVRACFSNKCIYEVGIEMKRFEVTQRRGSRVVYVIKIKFEAKRAPEDSGWAPWTRL